MLKYAAAALLAGTVLATATPAMAQDSAPFTGIRVEGVVGYDAITAGGDDVDDGIEGINYGIGVGFDFDMGGVVLGIEGELTESEANTDFNDTIDGAAFLGNIDIGRDVYIGGRVGFRAGASTLVYAKAGYTNTTVESAFTGNGGAADFEASVDGYRLGAGIEQMLGRNFFLKAEYRYSNYSGLRFDDAIFGDDDIEIDLDRHQGVVGVGVRF